MSRWRGFNFAGKLAITAALLAACIAARGAQDQAKPGEPTDPKARKTVALAREWERAGNKGAAMDAFRKADQQDGGQCQICLSRAYFDADSIQAYKDAEEIARLVLSRGHSDAGKAMWHLRLGIALQKQGILSKKEQFIADSADEFKAALALNTPITIAHYNYGISLAYLHQDDEARKQFAAFLDEDHDNPDLHERAQRFVDRVELARATMAPPFSVTTLDGQYVTMDALAGKVVLIDFWATWCQPCINALPHVRYIARKFAGQPFVLLSVNLDPDENVWRQFVAKHDMTWLQYHEGGFNGPLAKGFRVTAIPATFSVDADGVLEDEHVGDADIEGKLKKMISHAVEVQNRGPAPAVANPGPGGGN
jgi:thiol-disulfide isomerase/thioredoxin